MRSRSKNKEVVSAEYELNFGKYKGVTLGALLITNPSYIVWLSENDVLSVADALLEDAKFKIAESRAMRDFNFESEENIWK